MQENMHTSTIILQTNGLIVQNDFPAASYGEIHKLVAGNWSTHALYEHFTGAWSAVAYRFRDLVDCGDAFIELLKTYGTAPEPEERYQQEKSLFGFFSSGFSTFESLFYGLFTIGAFIAPAAFPLLTPKDQQQVSPIRAKDAFKKAFATDPIITVITGILADPDFQRWREVRNVLTHRTAPGRRMYVSIGSDDTPPDEWKLNNVPLDTSIISSNRVALTRLLKELLTATQTFVTARLH